MNDDLISRSALLEKATNVTKYDEGGWGVDLKAVSVEDVLKAPAVDAETVFEQMGLVKEAMDMAKADLVAVVRCKDCKWLCSGFDTYSCAKHTGLALIKPDGSDFCSYGERRSDDGK